MAKQFFFLRDIGDIVVANSFLDGQEIMRECWLVGLLLEHYGNIKMIFHIDLGKP